MDKLVELGLPPAVLDILKEDGINELYPPQAEAIPIALRGQNLLLAIPTASGKSLVAYLAVVKAVLNGGKALYIVPLRALASEKLDDLRRFEKLGIKVGMSIGDFDSPDIGLKRYDIIISTSEKADSLLRHRTDWLDILKVIVADEVHLLNDPGRGPTLEVTLSRFKQINPSAQIVALSATVSNAKELGEWLEAEVVQSEWRPVKLRPGVFYEGGITYSDGEEIETPRSVEGLIAQGVEGGGQCLVFVGTRRYTESLANSLCPLIEKVLNEAELKDLERESNRFVKGSTEPTSFGRRLASFVAKGVAYHHAGLRHDQRKLVEELFKARKIKVIAATPTLAAGINLPARRVIVRDVKRWSGPDSRMDYVPVMEIKQMLGRAGRPRYDTEGEGIIVARNHWEVDMFLENYIHGETEAVESKLGTETALRSHILSSIATGYAGSVDELMTFIGSTFFAHQQETWRIKDQVENVIDFLMDNDLVLSGDEGGLRTTFFGKRVSDLYIDPLSAIVLREALQLAKEKKAQGAELNAFSYLTAACATIDMSRVSGYIRKGEREWLDRILANQRHNLILPVDDPDDEDLLGQIKTASMILDWMNERPEDQMIEFYSVGPGDIRNRIETAEWMVYSMGELAKVLETGLEKEILPLTMRMRYGVKEELLDLCNLRGIGRVRARALFKRGYRTRAGIKDKAEEAVLAKIPTIGPAVAKSIIEQVRGREGQKEAAPGPALEEFVE
jgi:helicase